MLVKKIAPCENMKFIYLVLFKGATIIVAWWLGLITKYNIFVTDLWRILLDLIGSYQITVDQNGPVGCIYKQ